VPSCLAVYRAAFAGRLYLAAELTYDVPDDARLARLVELSAQTGIPLVAANAVHYHAPERRYLQDVLTCIREKCTIAEAGSRLFANAERHLRPLDEIARRYTQHADPALARAGREALERTLEITQRCTFSLDELRYEYPHELVPDGYTPMEYLAKLTWEGAVERYGHEGTEARRHEGTENRHEGTEARRHEGTDARHSATQPACEGVNQCSERERDSHERRDQGVSGSDRLAAGHGAGEPASEMTVPPASPSCLRAFVASWLSLDILDLLDRELALIAELRYEPYFLTVWDLVRFARSRGILCQGRGSAANSAVCYCLGVTAVDPTKIDLLFERFISRERNEPPDIDIDFEHERREEVFQYIYEKYGRERAAITAEVITYRPRSAVRDVGKALGLSLDRVDALAKTLDWWHYDEIPAQSIREAGLDPDDRTVRMVLRLVKQLLGFPRHLSQHVGGFVMTETPLCEIVPLENGAMPGRTFIEWDKDDIDALGILKVDCLALGMLTAIQKCFALLRDRGSGIGDRVGDQIHQGHLQTKKGEEHGVRIISRPERVEAVGRTGQEHLQADSANAGSGAIRVDRSNSTGNRVGPEQYCRRECAPNAQGLHSLPYGRAGFVGRTGNPAPHRPRIGHDSFQRTDLELDWRGHTDVAGTDQPPAELVTISSPIPDPRSPIPPSSASMGPRPANPIPDPRSPIPQSLVDVPPDDARVYDMICRADTLGVFQIESRAQMSMLPRLRPRCFYDLVIEVAIVRPGPIQGGMVHPYLRRRNGEEPVRYPSDAVRAVLEKTLGVPLFQEQVMRLAVVAAGFTPGEADQLRRAMAAWRRGGQIEKFQVKLMQGLLANGYSRQFAEQLFNQIRGFGEYGFPESHAASFALLVYVSAWLKCYYPAAFAAALLNSQPMGFYAPAQIIRDARAHGVTVLSVDVNASGWDCTLEAEDQGISRSLGLRLGMRLVRGLSAKKVRGIEDEQRRGAIRSIRQLARRTDVSRETLLRLAAADAFRSLGLSRRAALWQILALERSHKATEPRSHEGEQSRERERVEEGRHEGTEARRHEGVGGLFDHLEPREPPAALPEMSLEETVVQDYDAIGLSLNAHPIGLLRKELSATRISPIAAMQNARHKSRIAVAGLVTHRQRPGTAKGIVFMTIEDETGFANLIVHPRVWDREQRIARTKIALIAEGVVERQGEVIHLIVNRFRDVSEPLRELRHTSRDFH
jgi:error-prone DNA polymerase